jgi:adenine-specific DNA-methyltransferase
MTGKKKTKNIRVETVKHKDKRVNIPTEELRDFVAEDEKSPKTVFYPRDPSLDPQLVWKGKDEQDSKDLVVPAVPIYIQEKLQPKAIIENVRAMARKEKPEPQISLFADFNGIGFEELVDFYRHEQNWSNRMILGDSLLVMTSLAEKEGLKGKVQMIYVDPPYGIRFGSNWQVSTRKRDVKDGKVEDATRQPEQVRAFRDTWKLGIHSYLAYLRDRLVVARELLTETGSIFVQMNSESSHLVRSILDEIFGSENFVADIIFRKKSIPLGAKHLETMHDHILFYGRDISVLKFRHLYEQNDVSQISSHGPYALYQNDKWEKIEVNDFRNPRHPPGTKYYRLFSLLAPSYSAQTDFDYAFEDRIYSAPNRGAWVVSKNKLDLLASIGRLQREGSNLSYRLFYDDFPYKKRTNFWQDAQVSYDKSYVVQTAPSVIARCLLMTTDPGDLVLDPTCGSGTTAYVAEQGGRRWITIDTSRVALALARTRLMSARFPYYLLADSPEGIHKEAEVTGKLPPNQKTEGDIRKGFVYKRVPHITLKAIANNSEIDIIHEKWQEKLDPVLGRLNEVLSTSHGFVREGVKGMKKRGRPSGEKAKGENSIPSPSMGEGQGGGVTGPFQEWQVPREAKEDWPEEAKDLLTQWWELRKERQKEIDASIAGNADTEVLYDQPYEDGKRIRVTGPFTVESLSPHRVLSVDEERPRDEIEALEGSGAQQFANMILENLKKAGIQNTFKDERLQFDRLEPFAGTWLNAVGEYTEKDGSSRRVAVTIGPEHGTVGPQQIKEAAKEAVQGIGYDVLLACGFAFDPHVAEEARRYGDLVVLPTRMNPDLVMGDDLLKKTGAGNLFMVFGEPDVKIRKDQKGKVIVEIRGVDVYDPTTGQIRSNSTDDIACWFIDTDYNGESFFVRHAYFTGADQPYEKLKRALRAEVDESAWASLYSTKSSPFDPPSTGRIAIKVINHYGDEVLKVYESGSEETLRKA